MITRNILNHRHVSAIVVLTTIVAAGVAVSACRDDILNRDDTVVRSAGSAMRGNAAVHTIDPWPPGASRTRQNTDATKTTNAVEVYRRLPPIAQPKTSTTQASP